MLMKLAMYSEKNQARDISQCCEENGSIFIPFEKNMFGILDQAPFKIAYGQESESDKRGIKNKNFVEIYNCLLKLKNRSIFSKNQRPFEGLILDNEFFFKLIKFCNNRENVKINYLTYNSDIGSDTSLEDNDSILELEKEFENDNSITIFRISIQINDKEILFNKLGYVDIAAPDINYFDDNKNVLLNIIKTGLEG